MLEEYRAAVNARNVEAAVAFFADDAVITTVWGFKVIGKDAIGRRERQTPALRSGGIANRA